MQRAGRAEVKKRMSIDFMDARIDLAIRGVKFITSKNFTAFPFARLRPGWHIDAKGR
jgi:hypothetical protein